jgi:hypothetical protein
MIAGYRLIELWRDGLFIYIAPGDEEFLGWRMGGEDRPIHINNFVLAESTLVFCWLMKWIFEEAAPKPSKLRLARRIRQFDEVVRPGNSSKRSRIENSARPSPPSSGKGRLGALSGGTGRLRSGTHGVSADGRALPLVRVQFASHALC